MGTSPSKELHRAAARNDVRGVRDALNHGASTNDWSMDRTPLMTAAKNGSNDVIRYLFSVGATDHQNNRGYNSLHYAAKYGHAETAGILAQHGADHLEKTRKGYRAFHLAANRKFFAVVRRLEATTCPFFHEMDIYSPMVLGFSRWAARWVVLHRARPWDNRLVNRNQTMILVYKTVRSSLPYIELRNVILRSVEVDDDGRARFEVRATAPNARLYGNKTAAGAPVASASTILRVRCPIRAFEWLRDALSDDFGHGRGPLIGPNNTLVIPPYSRPTQTISEQQLAASNHPFVANSNGVYPTMVSNGQRTPTVADSANRRAQPSILQNVYRPEPIQEQRLAASRRRQQSTTPISTPVAQSDDPQTRRLVQELSAKVAQLPDDIEPPEHFLCPITFELMLDPVVASDGHTYDRASITRWIADHKTSPKTNLPLPDQRLIPNHLLRSQVQEWLEEALAVTRSMTEAANQDFHASEERNVRLPSETVGTTTRASAAKTPSHAISSSCTQGTDRLYPDADGQSLDIDSPLFAFASAPPPDTTSNRRVSGTSHAASDSSLSAEEMRSAAHINVFAPRENDSHAFPSDTTGRPNQTSSSLATLTSTTNTYMQPSIETEVHTPALPSVYVSDVDTHVSMSDSLPVDDLLRKQYEYGPLSSSSTQFMNLSQSESPLQSDTRSPNINTYQSQNSTTVSAPSNEFYSSNNSDTNTKLSNTKVNLPQVSTDVALTSQERTIAPGLIKAPPPVPVRLTIPAPTHPVQDRASVTSVVSNTSPTNSTQQPVIQSNTSSNTSAQNNSTNDVAQQIRNVLSAPSVPVHVPNRQNQTEKSHRTENNSRVLTTTFV